MDINWLAKAWGLDDDNQNKIIYFYTPAMSLIYGLREALALVAEEGLQNVITRHSVNSLILQKHIKSLKLQFLVIKPEDRLSGILSVMIPEGVDGLKVIQYLSEVHNIVIFGGLGPTLGKIWRMGLLGVNACEKSVSALCQALTEALKQQKYI